MKVSSELVEFVKEEQGVVMGFRKAEGVGMDQIGVEGEDSLVMAEALMFALRKWGRKRIPIGGVKRPLSSKLGVRRRL